MLQRVAAALISSKRPLLIIGKGVRWAAPFAELRELVDDLALPFITSPIGRGAIPDSHALCMNVVPWVAQSQADLVLLVGARLDWTFRYGRQIAPEATVIQVDVHAAEFGRNRKIELGVHADAGRFLRALLREIGQAQREPGAGPPRSRVDRRAAAIACRRCWPSVKRGRGSTDLYLPAPLGKGNTGLIAWRAISIFDSNLTMAACERMIPAQLPVSRLTPGTSGCLGVGIPYAIAAKLVHPERPVVAICGDFAFGLSVMELETAVRHNVPIVIVIANNNGNAGSLRQRMHMGNACEPIMMLQSGLRYDRIGEVLGGVAEHVEHAGDIGPAMHARLPVIGPLASILPWTQTRIFLSSDESSRSRPAPTRRGWHRV